jgi:hypothetical protein
MRRKLPKELTESQERRRTETANKVLRALIEMESQGFSLSIKNLMHFTGLSRSVFAKPHVRDVINEYCCTMPDPEAVTDVSGMSATQTVEQKLRAELEKRDERIGRLREKNAELTAECELLRGRLFLLMQKAGMD